MSEVKNTTQSNDFFKKFRDADSEVKKESASELLKGTDLYADYNKGSGKSKRSCTNNQQHINTASEGKKQTAPALPSFEKNNKMATR